MADKQLGAQKPSTLSLDKAITYNIYARERLRLSKDESATNETEEEGG